MTADRNAQRTEDRRGSLRSRLDELLRLDEGAVEDGMGRIAFVLVVPWVAVPLLAWYTVDAFSAGGDSAWTGLYHSACAAVLLLSGIAVRLRSTPPVISGCARLSLGALMLLMVAAFLFQRSEFTLLWVGVVPMTSIFVLGLREGLLWCLATLVAWLLLFAQADRLAQFSPDVHWPGPGERQDFAVAFLALTGLAGGFELLRQRVRRRLLEQTDALLQTSRLESVGRLTSGVAHDFNNLLTVVIGNLDLLAAQAENAGLAMKQLDRARSASHRAADLTEKLLSFARRQPLRPEPVEIAALLADMEPLFETSLGETVSVAVGVADTPLYCFADRGQLENALLNLALNARDAMPGGGELTIVGQRVTRTPGDGLRAGDYVRIAVSDDGPGIPPDVLERVFEPFFTTKELGAGTGLGLSMVQGFMRQSGGEVRIRDRRPDRTWRPGTTVELYLPAADAPALRAGSPSSS